jgi:hypothetical protein
MMDNDDDWQEAEMAAGAGNRAPVLAVSYFDSLAQLRGRVAESWQELQALYEDDQAPLLLRGLAFESANVALRIEIDDGLECAVCLYPRVAGELCHQWEQGGEALFQLNDDGQGMVDPQQLWFFFEYLLDDILPAVGDINRQEILERFAGGSRPLALCDPTGSLLELPDSDAGDR